MLDEDLWHNVISYLGVMELHIATRSDRYFLNCPSSLLENHVNDYFHLNESEADAVQNEGYMRDIQDGHDEAARNTVLARARIGIRNRVSVCRGSLQRLMDQESWINDEVITYYLQVCLNARDEIKCVRVPGRKRQAFFNSFFMQKLLDVKNQDTRRRNRYDYSHVSNWGSRVPGGNIFHLKRLFVPINMNDAHWTLAVINMEEKTISYFDSMGHTIQKFLTGILQYLCDEHISAFNMELVKSDWKIVSTPNDIPLQQNGENICVISAFFMFKTTDITELNDLLWKQGMIVGYLFVCLQI